MAGCDGVRRGKDGGGGWVGYSCWVVYSVRIVARWRDSSSRCTKTAGDSAMISGSSPVFRQETDLENDQLFGSTVGCQ